MYVVEVSASGTDQVSREFGCLRSALTVACGYKRASPGATIMVLDEDGATVQSWVDGRFRFKGGFSHPVWPADGEGPGGWA